MNSLENTILQNTRQSVKEMADVTRDLIDPDDLDIVQDNYNSLGSVFLLGRIQDSGMSETACSELLELEQEAYQILQNAGRKATRLMTEAITLDIPVPVLAELSYLVSLHQKHGAANPQHSLDELILAVLNAVSDGSRRPGSWERQMLEMMGLVADTPVHRVYRELEGEPLDEASKTQAGSPSKE